MLGHDETQGKSDFVFRLAPEPLSPMPEVLGLLLVHLSVKHPQITDLYHVFGADHILRFLALFGGSTIKVPNGIDDDVEFTLLPEISLAFGNELLTRFLEFFSGKKLRLPSEEIILEGFRASDIYHRMTAKHRRCVKELASYYQISDGEVWWTYRRMDGLFKTQPHEEKEEDGRGFDLDSILGPEEEDDLPEEVVEGLLDLARAEASRLQGYAS